VLRWVQDRAARPLLLAIDDMHWADADSLALVSFLCRRMGGLRAGLIASLRPWPARAGEVAAGLASEGCGSIQHLAPLSEAAAGSLLQARLGRSVPGPVRRRVFELCARNPLLVEQLAVAIGHGENLPELAGTGAGAFGRGGVAGPVRWPAAGGDALRAGGSGAGRPFPAGDRRAGGRAARR